MRLVFNPFTSSLDYVASNLLDVGVTSATAQYQVLTTGATPFAPLFSGWLLDGTTGGKTVLAVTSAKTLTLTATDNFNLTIPATGTAALLATTNQFTANQGFGIAADTYSVLLASKTWTDTVNVGGALNTATFNATFNPAASSAASIYASKFFAQSSGAQPLTNTMGGLFGQVRHNNTNTLAIIKGLNFAISNINSGVITDAYGLDTSVATTSGNITRAYASVFGVSASAGTIGSGYGAYIQMPGISGTGIITTSYGIRILTPSIAGTGTITTQTGLAINNIAGATNNNSIVTGTGLISFGDQVKITGSADRVQFRILANATQTALLATWETSASAVVNSMSLTAGAIFNEQGDAAIDFRVESDTLDAIFVDSSADTVALKGGQVRSYVAKTANYTLTLKDYVCDVTANTINITLPTAVGCTGQIYHVNNSGTGVVTILTTSSQTINGAASQLVYQYESIALMSNNANWIIL